MTIHEAGIAQNIIRIVEAAAEANALKAVSKIVVEIGQMSGVEIGALEFAFGALKRGTRLEGAEIEVVAPPLLLFCRTCQNEYVGDPEDLRCPACLRACFDVLQGHELKVRSILGRPDEE